MGVFVLVTGGGVSSAPLLRTLVLQVAAYGAKQAEALAKDGVGMLWLCPGLPLHPPSGANSQADPGPDPDRQLRWQLMGALVERKLPDSTVEPGEVVVAVRPWSPQSPTLPATYFPSASFLCRILVTCSSFSASAKSDSHSSLK